MTRSEYDIPQPEDGSTPAGAGSRSHDGPLLDDPRAVETLVRHDEASAEELSALEKDPSTARVLDRLREADRWLFSALEGNDASLGADLAPTTRADEVSAEELYDYGAGPGATELDPERRAVVEAYLADRPEEAAWVQGLSRPVPAPLAFEPLTPNEEHIRALRSIPGPTAPTAASPLRRAPAWLTWAPLAAAALVLAMALGGEGRRNALDGGLPDSPVLRSTQIHTVLFPRGRVLAPVEGATTYASQPLFEVTPVEGATEYRFELRVGVVGAFDEGDVVWSATTTTPIATASALAPGAYAWHAWARVDGLERSLDMLSFTVVEPARSDILRSAAGVAPDARSTREDVRLLHAAGFLTDARHRARTLPPGADRAKYLSEGR